MATGPALIALDVAVLLPPDVSRRAIDLSAALPAEESRGLRLGPGRLPHITLTQQFIREDALDDVLARVGLAIRHDAPIPLAVTGGGRGRGTVWLAIAPSPALADLHRRLMTALEEFGQEGGTEAAFLQGDARTRDVDWVTGYRHASSFESFAPHITLGHAGQPPRVDAFHFQADTIAACHLGRFCSCAQVLRSWRLQDAGSR